MSLSFLCSIALRLEVVVRFVDISRIIDHYCLIFLLMNDS